MFRRLKLLTLLQLSDRLKIKKIENKKQLVAKIAVSLLLLTIVTGVVCVIFYLLTEFMAIPKDKNIAIFLIFILQLLSVIACTNGLLKTLYTGKDNMILLSYPAKHYEVFVSKLLVFYIYEFIKSLYLMLPILLGVGVMITSIDAIFLLTVAILLILLPIFPVLIGALLTIPLVLLNRIFIKFPFLKTLGGIGLLVLLFFAITLIMNQLDVPFRMLALYNRFINSVIDFISEFNKYALYYRSIGAALFHENLAMNYGIIFGVLILLIALRVLISMPLYFKLASKSAEHANTKNHRGGNVAHKNTFFTFVKKEFLLSTRNFSEFINNYSFLIALPYVLYLVTTINLAVYRNELGIYLTVAAVGFVALVMSSASNTSSALAITQEGSEFVLLKTVPANTSNMCWAKIFFNVVFSSVMIIISFLIIQIFGAKFCREVTLPNGDPFAMEMISHLDLWCMCACVIIINFGLILWSFQLDINNPSLREYASNGDATAVKNVSQSIKIGLIVTLLFTGLAVFFLIDGGSSVITWVKLLGLAFAFLVARFYFFRNYLKYVFPRIEY